MTAAAPPFSNPAVTVALQPGNACDNSPAAERRLKAILKAEMARQGLVGRPSAHWEDQGGWWCWGLRIVPKADPERTFKAGEEPGHHEIPEQVAWAVRTCKATMSDPRRSWGECGRAWDGELNSGFYWGPTGTKQQREQTRRVD